MKYSAATLFAASLSALSSQALAGPSCTDEPTSKWLTEEQMMEKIKDMGYKDIRNFHVSKGKCYEIYGYDRDGRKVEVYFHPISGEIAEAKVK
jgi:hypothetical protein